MTPEPLDHTLRFARMLRSVIVQFRPICLVVLSDLGLLKYTSKYFDPFVVLWVSPGDIERVTGRPDAHKNAWTTAGLVLDGDWDQTDERFVDSSEWYRCLFERYVDDIAWSETSAIQSRVVRVRNGERVMDNRTSETGVFERCRYLDQLYTNIKNHGYQTQPELLAQGRGTPYEKILPYKKHYHEVAVDIGRDGDLLFVDGRHRLSLAKILDADRIPVRVVAVHERFVESERTLEYEFAETEYGHPLCPRYKPYAGSLPTHEDS